MPSERRDIEELLVAVGAATGGHEDLVECLEHSAIGIHVVDRAGAIVWVNPAMCATLRRPAEQCLGRHVAELHVDDAVLSDMWFRLRAGEVVHPRPARLRADGGVRDVILSGRAGRDHHGAFLGARFCARPVDLDLARAPEPDVSILDQSPLGVVRARADAVILAVNPALCALLGRTRAQLVGSDLFALTHPDDRQLERDKFDQLRAGQIGHYVLVRRLLRDDGSSVWTRLHACAVRDASGAVLFYLGLIDDIDAPHRIEEQRRQAARQFEILTRLSPVGIFLGDADGQCVYVNAEWSRITGRTLPEARGSGWRRAVHPDDLGRVLAGCQAAFADHQPYRSEWRMLRPDGAVVWVLGQFAEFASGDDPPIHVGTLTDISARVRAELDRARLADIVESAADALLLLHPDGTIAIWNIGAEQLLGYASAEIEGRQIGALIPEVAAGLSRVVAGAIVRETETLVRHNDGSTVAVDITACPVYDASGDISGVSIVLHDISELKNAEQALRLSEERFRSLVEVTSQIVWSTDAEGRIVEDSPSWRAFTGQTFEAMRGWGWVAAIAPEQQDRIIARWKDAVAARKPVTSEYRVRRADGTYADTQVRAVPLMSPGGVVREWVGVSVDISEQRRTEHQREALVADLRRAMHYQDMFIAVLSHDLRSPLSAVLMATNLGLRRCADDRLRRVLQQVASSGQRMLRMIEQLLDVSRIRAAGGLEIRPTRADLAAICRTIIDELQQAHPDARVVLDTRGETEGTWDVDRLSQVASNLIGNAIQHAAGARVATVLVDGRDPATVEFVVHNRGVIASDSLATIFDPFHRPDTGPGRATGLGLGLYITAQIAVAHGGGVRVESTATGGTYFRVELPRHPRPADLTPAGASDDHDRGDAPLLRGEAAR